MTADNHTTIRLTSEELEALRKATEVKFGSSGRVSRGAMVRLLAEGYVRGLDDE